MQLYYALYDPSVFIGGNYWTWAASEIKPLLNRFYNDVAAKHLPPNPNELQDNDLWGGLVRFADWTVAYRYYNGGRDKQERPGRYILLTAWIMSGDAQQIDLLPIFSNETFRHVAENATKIPIPSPFSLKSAWRAESVPAVPFQDGETTFYDLSAAMQAFASVPSHRKTEFVIADVKIIKTAEKQKYVLDVVPEFKHTPLTTTKQPEVKKTVKTETSRRNFSLILKILLFVILLCAVGIGVWFIVEKGHVVSPPVPQKIESATSIIADRNIESTTTPSPTDDAPAKPTVPQPEDAPHQTRQQQIEEMFRQLPPEEQEPLAEKLLRIARERPISPRGLIEKIWQTQPQRHPIQSPKIDMSPKTNSLPHGGSEDFHQQEQE
jgi:hypothetical protein